LGLVAGYGMAVRGGGGVVYCFAMLVFGGGLNAVLNRCASLAAGFALVSIAACALF
jgi:hypothetical protein